LALYRTLSYHHFIQEHVLLSKENLPS
jgi:hypothetical protein